MTYNSVSVSQLIYPHQDPDAGNIVPYWNGGAAGVADQYVCKWGHTEGRYANGNCKVCSKARIRRWVAANPKKKAAIAAKYNKAHPKLPAKRQAQAVRYRSRNKNILAKKDRDYRLANPEKGAAKSRRWRSKNLGLAQKSRRLWGISNPEKQRALVAKRAAQRLRATPAWADHERIEAVYTEAVRLEAITGIPHEVDHIIPLRGRNVCGLHVHYNLQAITAAENRKKGNRV